MSGQQKQLSGLQKQVLSLYRTILRAIREKPEENRQQFVVMAREEFRKNQGLGRADVS
jgi:succinate dehydrogenase assembly factor 1